MMRAFLARRAIAQKQAGKSIPTKVNMEHTEATQDDAALIIQKGKLPHMLIIVQAWSV